MTYHWQSSRHKRSGVDDMVLLPQVSESSICENLKKRLMDDWIFTYIGPVLISVNPFKQMPYFTDKEIEQYQGAAQYENPPHVYALADTMYRNLTIDNESQCVIISGESGAGKTVAAKYIMDYVAKISGGGERSQHVKNVVKYSNPLLEAFGNAKTVRNNNSSRFGKYVEIFFNAGQPAGGEISNFLLEKSRVVLQNPGERNFHIFYQMIAGSTKQMQETCGILPDLDYYNYLNATEYTVPGTDDAKDWLEVLEAMNIMELSQDQQYDVISTVSAILHLGNIFFAEGSTEQALPQNNDALEYPALLLGLEARDLSNSLVGHLMESNWGKDREVVRVAHNVQQAEQTRDALSKAVYSRIFDFLVERVNSAMKNPTKVSNMNNNIGILDIYGFEIFQTNGFEQFCINFVNEKLQQIFIQLTLKNEQDEYVQEGIKWKQIDYFNNKVVCDLIEDRSPPGIMAVLDDTSLTMNAVREGADQQLKMKLKTTFTRHEYFDDAAIGFVIHHYAGKVSYSVEGFVEKNRDILFTDLIEMMQKSSSCFVRSLFPEKVDRNDKKRPTTAGAKIKRQANDLVGKLMLCIPHYVRCIKPNETKKPHDWEQVRVMHQVEYLGLKENIRVRRAGFAFRRQFDKFVLRYAILTPETWPPHPYRGDARSAVEHILRSVNMEQGQYQMGKTKIFIKAPESLFLLEEVRERKFDQYARTIQKAFRKYFSQQKLLRQKEEASDIFFKKKERREHSLNRNFYSDYIGLDHRPELRALVGKRDKVEFSQTVDKYDRRFKAVKRDLILTGKGLWLIGREIAKDGPSKGQHIEVVKRHITLDKISKVGLSPRQDDFLLIYVTGDAASLIKLTFKTEFVTSLARLVKEKTTKDLKLHFDEILEFTVRKGGFGGEKRKISFTLGNSHEGVITTTGIITKEATVAVARGLPNDTRPKRSAVGGQTGGRARGGSRLGPSGGHFGGQARGGGQSVASGGGWNPAVWQGKGRGGGQGGLGRGGSGGLCSGGGGHVGPSGDGGGHVGPPEGEAGRGQDIRPVRAAQGRPQIQESQTKGRENIAALAQRLASVKAAQPPGQQARGSSRRVDQPEDQSFLATPEGGASRSVRQSLSSDRPLPGQGRPKPAIRKLQERKVRALYDYVSQDLDELSLAAGQIFVLVKEDQSGWWTGRVEGKEGFFPGNYVEKI